MVAAGEIAVVQSLLLKNNPPLDVNEVEISSGIVGVRKDVSTAPI